MAAEGLVAAEDASSDATEEAFAFIEDRVTRRVLPLFLGGMVIDWDTAGGGLIVAGYCFAVI